MSYQGNNCPNCSENCMCPVCYLGMAEFYYESAKNELFEAQKKEGNLIRAISYWDVECKETMSKVEYFREKLKEKHELSNSRTSKRQ